MPDFQHMLARVNVPVLAIFGEQDRNERNAATISTEASKCRVVVTPSEEDSQIARHCRSLMRSCTSSAYINNLVAYSMY